MKNRNGRTLLTIIFGIIMITFFGALAFLYAAYALHLFLKIMSSLKEVFLHGF